MVNASCGLRTLVTMCAMILGMWYAPKFGVGRPIGLLLAIVCCIGLQAAFYMGQSVIDWTRFKR